MNINTQNQKIPIVPDVVYAKYYKPSIKKSEVVSNENNQDLFFKFSSPKNKMDQSV